MNIIGLLRHGPTAWNRSKQIQGTRDIPLDTIAFPVEPWQQLLSRFGPWDHVVTSSLSRCRETCHLLLPGQAYDIDIDLREQDWGKWTAQTLKQIGVESPGSIEAQERLGWDFTPPGGESRREVLMRVQAAIHRITGDRDGQHILLVTHLGVIKILLNHLQNTPFLPEHSTPVAKRALHLLSQDAAKLSILQTNIESQ
jgi:probable phosphoglycerate mutase